MHSPPLTLWHFADVAAALEHPALSLDGVARTTPRQGAGTEGAARHAVDVARLLPIMRVSARALAAAIPAGECVDLCESFATPWSHEIAIEHAGSSHENGPTLLAISRRIFLAAAHATDRQSARVPSPDVGALAAALSPADASFGVQAFVALANTLPLLLAGAWHALVTQPGAWRALGDRSSPARRSAVIDELLRLASPARVVFRQAKGDMTIGGRQVAAGGELVLALQQANRCPARFADPGAFAPERFAPPNDGRRHVGLGLAPHACAGSALVRAALEIATSALLDEFTDISLAGPVTWLGGFAIDGPTSLPVTLRRGAAARGAEGACPA